MILSFSILILHIPLYHKILIIKSSISDTDNWKFPPNLLWGISPVFIFLIFIKFTFFSFWNKVCFHDMILKNILNLAILFLQFNKVVEKAILRRVINVVESAIITSLSYLITIISNLQYSTLLIFLITTPHIKELY